LKTSTLPYRNLLHNFVGLDSQLLTIVTSLTLSASPIVDLNSLASDSAMGASTPSYTIDENNVRSSVYNRLVAVNETTPNINITLNTMATKILLCQESGKVSAYGFEITSGALLPVAAKFDRKKDVQADLRTVKARHEVIVSAGVFQSPQLLMLSGIGSAAELQKHGISTVVDLPGVGKNLQDHDELSVIWRLKNEFKLFQGCSFLGTEEDPCLEDWLKSRHRNLYAFGASLKAIISKSKDTLPDPDILTYYLPGYFEGFVRGLSQLFADNRNVLTAIVLKAHPSSKGTVSLTGAHPQDPIKIDKMHFQAEGGLEDVEALADGITRARNFVENSRISGYVVEEIFPGRDANLTQHVYDHVFGHHACCTNAIGPDDDKDAVLDGDFRVRGVENLRVVDLSSWPKVPGFFVTTPTYMMSEKAADVIMQSAKQRDVQRIQAFAAKQGILLQNTEEL